MKNLKKLSVLLLAFVLLASVVCSMFAYAGVGPFFDDSVTASIWLKAYDLNGNEITNMNQTDDVNSEFDMPADTIYLEIGITVPKGCTGGEFDLVWDSNLVSPVEDPLNNCYDYLNEEGLGIVKDAGPFVTSALSITSNVGKLDQGWWRLVMAADATTRFQTKEGRVNVDVTETSIAYLMFEPKSNEAATVEFQVVLASSGMLFARDDDAETCLEYKNFDLGTLSLSLNGGSEAVSDPIATLGAVHSLTKTGLRFGAKYTKTEGEVSDLGFVVIPSTKFDGGKLSVDTEGATVVRAEGIANFAAGKSFDEYENIVYYVSLINIPEAYQGTDIVAVPYVVIDGNTVYGEQIERNYIAVRDYKFAD